MASIFGNLARPETLQTHSLRGRSSAGLIPADLVLPGTDTLGSVPWENRHFGLVCGRCLGFMKDDTCHTGWNVLTVKVRSGFQ